VTKDWVFLDAVGMIAIWNRTDQWHADAQRAYDDLIRDRAVLLTTTFVICECGNAAARWPFRRDVNDLRERLEAHRLLVWPNDDDWTDAWTAYQRGDGGQAGIVDQVSFAVMRRLGLIRVFSNDHHFRAAGFTTLF
jgi:predicted nucleic acid-binding protein